MDDFSMDLNQPDDGGLRREEAERTVKAPSIGLIVCGALAIMMGLQNVVTLAMGPSDPWEGMSEEDRAEMEENMGWLVDAMESAAAPATAIVSLLITVGCGVLMLMGGLKMMKLEKLGLSKTACWVAALFSICCCFVSTVFGIWGLVVLGKNEVSSQFKS